MPNILLTQKGNGFSFIDCYEALRASRLGEVGVLNVGIGLAIFLHRGMFAWMQCLSSVQLGQRKEMQAPAVAPRSTHVFTSPQRFEMIAILTQLAFSQQPRWQGEVYA